MCWTWTVPLPLRLTNISDNNWVTSTHLKTGRTDLFASAYLFFFNQSSDNKSERAHTQPPSVCQLLQLCHFARACNSTWSSYWLCQPINCLFHFVFILIAQHGLGVQPSVDDTWWATDEGTTLFRSTRVEKEISVFPLEKYISCKCALTVEPTFTSRRWRLTEDGLV